MLFPRRRLKYERPSLFPTVLRCGVTGFLFLKQRLAVCAGAGSASSTVCAFFPAAELRSTRRFASPLRSASSATSKSTCWCAQRSTSCPTTAFCWTTPKTLPSLRNVICIFMKFSFEFCKLHLCGPVTSEVEMRSVYVCWKQRRRYNFSNG